MDPINLIFTGRTDVRSLRAALLALDGDRSAFGLPAQPPFDCRWADAIGGIQGTYSTEQGGTGSVIQLECGEYTTLRFHVRCRPGTDSVVCVLRRGPTDWFHVARWNLAHDELEHGAWLRATIYPLRCAVSPDGALLAAFIRDERKASASGTGTSPSRSSPGYEPSPRGQR